MKVGRVISNSPSSQGAIGDIYNTNTPSLTLGCGSYGHNSTTSNVSSVNLINKKRIAKRRAVSYTHLIKELMHTDLPEPVEPAISRWGIFAKSVRVTCPAISRPRVTVSLLFAKRKLLDSTSSRILTTLTTLLGTSMPVSYTHLRSQPFPEREPALRFFPPGLREHSA